MDNESTPMITPTELQEYAYCPRFIYFMNCLNIPQHEELRYKVLQGRELHEHREHQNRSYMRKKIDCVQKEISVYLASPKLRVRGIVDEVLYFADGTMAPLDYKMTEFHDYTFKTHRWQSVLYAMLIQETYQKTVKKGYICYIARGSVLKELEFLEKDFMEMGKIIDEVFSIIYRGYFPRAAPSKIRCVDCCYRNICPK